MNSISIITSQNIALEFELASLGDRVLGRILDWLMLIAYCLVVMALIGFGKFGRMSENNAWLMIIVIGFPLIFYDLLAEILLNGQSPGKKIMGIKVISLNGGQASFSQYLIRWLFRIIDFSFGGVIALALVGASEKKQRLGDLVAGTVLIKLRQRTQLTDTIFQAVQEDVYQVTYPEVINLKDRDIQLIKDILKNVYQTNNYDLAFQAQQKIESILSISSRHSDATNFLKAVLLDYNYLTSKL